MRSDDLIATYHDISNQYISRKLISNVFCITSFYHLGFSINDLAHHKVTSSVGIMVRAQFGGNASNKVREWSTYPITDSNGAKVGPVLLHLLGRCADLSNSCAAAYMQHLILATIQT